MTPRETRAKMLAHSWAHGLYPEHGDVKAMTMGLEDAGEGHNGEGIGVFGLGAEPEQLAEVLIDQLVGTVRRPPVWLALTATAYFDTLASARAARQRDLEEFPTPTTRHGLMVLIADKDGLYMAMWQVDLKIPLAPLDLPDEPAFTNENETPRGANPVLLLSLFRALVDVGEMP